MVKFNYIIGNPPYQDDQSSSNRQEPLYHTFMDAAYELGDVVELITPARFLFDAGQTPKSWNKKMLNDEHLKVLMYERDCKKIFPSTDIKGGVAVTIRDSRKNYGAIGVFVDDENVNAIKQKVVPQMEGSLADIGYPKSNYSFSKVLYDEHPELKTRLTSGNEYIIDASIFSKMPEIFSNEKYDGSIGVHGRLNNTRVCKYVKAEYIRDSICIKQYKVFVPGANGSGEYGCTLSSPFVGRPDEIGTQTYMSFGNFDDEYQAASLVTYMKTKFARGMLGVLKVTQNNPVSTWRYVPLQDFTDLSDIDWSVSIPEIDQQLYRKYNLTPEEIEFIETHVKPME